MPYFVNTYGHATLAVGICGRCSLKFPLDDLAPDPNSPGLLVCVDDLDDYDPYRLPPRELEDITLLMPRPDVDLVTVTVLPGGAGWPPSTFPDDGLQANQIPADGVGLPFSGSPNPPPQPPVTVWESDSLLPLSDSGDPIT